MYEISKYLSHYIDVRNFPILKVYCRLNKCFKKIVFLVDDVRKRTWSSKIEHSYRGRREAVHRQRCRWPGEGATKPETSQGRLGPIQQQPPRCPAEGGLLPNAVVLLFRRSGSADEVDDGYGEVASGGCGTEEHSAGKAHAVTEYKGQ